MQLCNNTEHKRLNFARLADISYLCRSEYLSYVSSRSQYYKRFWFWREETLSERQEYPYGYVEWICGFCERWIVPQKAFPQKLTTAMIFLTRKSSHCSGWWIKPLQLRRSTLRLPWYILAMQIKKVKDENGCILKSVKYCVFLRVTHFLNYYELFYLCCAQSAL